MCSKIFNFPLPLLLPLSAGGRGIKGEVDSPFSFPSGEGRGEEFRQHSLPNAFSNSLAAINSKSPSTINLPDQGSCNSLPPRQMVSSPFLS